MPIKVYQSANALIMSVYMEDMCQVEFWENVSWVFASNKYTDKAQSFCVFHSSILVTKRHVRQENKFVRSRVQKFPA